MAASPGGAGEVFRVFLGLGLTAFGGPTAHLGFFRKTVVERHRWLDDGAYADLVALCQILPGPTSSQVGLAIGLGRAGWAGAVAAWAGFTLPSAILLVLFAYGAGQGLGGGWLHGLKAAAVAVVAQALVGMARSLAPDLPRAGLALVAAGLALALPGAAGQLGGLAIGAAFGLALHRAAPGPVGAIGPASVSRRTGAVCLALFALLLAGLPLLAALAPSPEIRLAAIFYRAGALVFGGGHVVLPLLQAPLVPEMISNDAFLAGYGAAQAVPGPLFTLAAYLGAALRQPPNGVAGAMLCLGFIFLPSWLLVPGMLPFWADLARRTGMRAALTGVNAAVVGLLGAAFYDPVLTAGVRGPGDLLLALAAFAALGPLRAPPWLVVAASAAAGAALGLGGSA